MKKITTAQTFIITGLLLIVPAFAFAGDPSATTVSSGITSFATLINTFTSSIGKALATLFLSLALIAFFWGIVEYIWGIRNGDTKKVTDGNTFIKWALVALFVMFSVYGIIKFGQQFLCGGACDQTITIPDINFKTGSSATTATSPSLQSPKTPTTPTTPTADPAQDSSSSSYDACIAAGGDARQCDFYIQ
jgi:succinate dehydrogenase/fumarate reductase cytochrome b subunit